MLSLLFPELSLYWQCTRQRVDVSVGKGSWWVCQLQDVFTMSFNVQAFEQKSVTTNRFQNVLVGRFYTCKWFKVHPSSLLEEGFFLFKWVFFFIYYRYACWSLKWNSNSFTLKHLEISLNWKSVVGKRSDKINSVSELWDISKKCSFNILSR